MALGTGDLTWVVPDTPWPTVEDPMPLEEVEKVLDLFDEYWPYALESLARTGEDGDLSA